MQGNLEERLDGIISAHKSAIGSVQVHGSNRVVTRRLEDLLKEAELRGKDTEFCKRIKQHMYSMGRVV